MAERQVILFPSLCSGRHSMLLFGGQPTHFVTWIMESWPFVRIILISLKKFSFFTNFLALLSVTEMGRVAASLSWAEGG